jgi:uncharacterized repeat protein (TIGR03803 family)
LSVSFEEEKMSLGRNPAYRFLAVFCALAVALLYIVATPLARAQTYTDLLNFDGKHGAGPDYPCILAQGRDGTLYGTTQVGNDELGVVFSVTPSGTPKVLHYFVGTDGARPFSGLTLGTDGSFYGTTLYGGSGHNGTLFKITPGGSLTTIHDFTSAEGIDWAPPIEAADGIFYGITERIVYRFTRSGTFMSLGLPPGGSTSPLLQAADGTLFGSTGDGGKYGDGTVFKITSVEDQVIFNFDPHAPAGNAPLIQAADGDLYGTTGTGGDYRQGIVFKLTPKGSVTALHNFPDPGYPHDGIGPYAGLVQATDGNFYGVTQQGGTTGYGVIFAITATGDYSVLHNFDLTTGSNPDCTPMQHTNGKIYGMTAGGGTDSMGVVYALDLGLPPFVRFLPAIGTVGETIEFLGQGFTGTTAVSFNGTAASFTVVSDTYLTAIVPTGATSGTVTVTTPGGVLNSNQAFRVVP